MANPDIEKRKQNLSLEIQLLENWWKLIDDDTIVAKRIGSHYLIVAAYGIVESEMKTLIKSYIGNNFPPKIARVLMNHVSNRYSWGYKRIEKTLAEFNEDWCTQANEKLSVQQTNSFTSLKDSRNAIAHGDSNEVTFEDAKVQFESAIEGLHIISDIITTKNANAES